MDRFQSLKIFGCVAEKLSFTEAADSLNLPKASVSTTIRDLEEHLGVRLFHRTTRQVTLTPDGANFLERCQQILMDLEDVESMFQAKPEHLKGKIRVDMSIAMARDGIVPRLPEFLKAHPGIEIELSSTDHRVDLNRDGIDCVIRAGGAPDENFVERELGRILLINCASPSYLEQYGKPKGLDDLKNHRLVHFTQAFNNKPATFEYFDGERYREIKMKNTITVNNTDSYKAACIAGLGIAQIPLVGVKEHLKRGVLVEVLPKLRAEPMKLKLIYHPRRLVTKRVRVFMDWLESVVREYLK